MELIQNYAFEALIASIVGLIPFFFKRTLNNYDRRIQNTEINHQQILDKLHKIDMELMRVATTLEVLGKD